MVGLGYNLTDKSLPIYTHIILTHFRILLTSGFTLWPLKQPSYYGNMLVKCWFERWRLLVPNFSHKSVAQKSQRHSEQQRHQFNALRNNITIQHQIVHS